MKITAYVMIAIFLLLIVFTRIPVGVIIVAMIVIGGLVGLKRYNDSKTLKHTIREIDSMTGEEFEFYVAKIFQNMGYRAQVTQTSGDYGADVVAQRLNHGKPEKIVIQCKRYQGKVGISAVQEIVGAKAYYKADKMYVITNSYYTDAAKNLAHSNKVVLWDRDTLQSQLKKLSHLELETE